MSRLNVSWSAVSALRSLFGLNGIAEAIWSIRADVQRITAAIADVVKQLSELRTKIGNLQEHSIDEAIANGINRFPLDQAPRMQMGTSSKWPLADVERLWNHVAATWTSLGASDPYFSVWTSEEFHLDKLNPEDIERFFATSKLDVARMHSWFGRHGRPVPHSGVIAEYGCGVGRSTPIFAREFARVKAFDISRPHLHICQNRLDSQKVTNVELIQISDFRSLKRLTGYDVFYSCIVLQHNPPPLIAAIIRQALHGLDPGGFAFFQVPTYSRGYRFDLEEYVARIRDGTIGTAMEMHLLPQEMISNLSLNAAADYWKSSRTIVSVPMEIGFRIRSSSRSASITVE